MCVGEDGSCGGDRWRAGARDSGANTSKSRPSAPLTLKSSGREWHAESSQGRTSRRLGLPAGGIIVVLSCWDPTRQQSEPSIDRLSQRPDRPEEAKRAGATTAYEVLVARQAMSSRTCCRCGINDPRDQPSAQVYLQKKDCLSIQVLR